MILIIGSVGASLIIPFFAYSINITVPQSPANGTVLVGKSNGVYLALPSTTTANLFIDVNRTDTYPSTGGILSPFKSLSSAIASSTGYSGYIYNLSPGTYVDGAPDTFPANPFTIQGNQATYVPASGVTLPGSFDIYDLTIAGNVTETHCSLSTLHQMNNGVVTGNFTGCGLDTFEGMAFTGTTTAITQQAGSLGNFVGSISYGNIINAGTLNINDSQIQISTTTNISIPYSVYSSSTGSVLYTNGLTLINTAGGGIYTANGATSSPNIIFAASMVVNSTTPGSTLNAGSAATVACDLVGLTNLAGTFIAPTGSNWQPCYDENRAVLNNLTVGSTTLTSSTFNVNGVGTADIADFASSSGTSALHITQAGNVGIGTSTPGSNLVIMGANFVPGSPTPSLGTNAGNLEIMTTDSMAIDKGGDIAFGGSASGTGWQPFGEISARKENSVAGNQRGYMAFDVTGSGSTYERMRINSNGNVGIGTVAPSYVLDVTNQPSILAGNLLRVATSTGAGLYVINNGNVGIGTTNASAPLTVATANTNTSGSNFNFLSSLIVNPASAPNANYRGQLIQVVDNLGAADFTNATLYGTLDQITHNATTTLGNAFGSYNNVTNTNGGTISTAALYSGVLSNSSTGTITSAYGFLSPALLNSNGGIVSNYYNFFASDSPNAASSTYGFYSNLSSGTNKWNFYANGTAPSYFNGSVGIGTSTPTQKVVINGSLLFPTLGSGVMLNRNTSAASYIAMQNIPGTDIEQMGLPNSNIGAIALQWTNTGGTKLMALTGDGRFGVGTTVPFTTFGVVASTTASTVDPFDVASTSGSSYLHVTYGGNVGVGTNAPNATLHDSGSFAAKYTIVPLASTTYTIATSTDNVIYISTTTAASTINLPACLAATDQIQYIVKDKGGNAGTQNITVTATGGGTIDNASTEIINANFGSTKVQCVSSGTWFTLP